MAKFNAPVIQDNPSGWGPCAVPEKFKDMPYQPFSKGDRLGKVCSLMIHCRILFSTGSCLEFVFHHFPHAVCFLCQVADWTGATYQDKRYTSESDRCFST